MPDGNLYETAEFQELWQEFNRSYLPWDEFKKRPLPPGATAEETWRAIAALRKGAGTTFEYPPWFPFIENGSIWFSTPEDSQERLRRISAKSASGSQLARTIAKLDGFHFCQYLMLDEFLAACRSDGVMVDRERARQAALHGIPPQSDAERLFVNLCSTYADATRRYAGRTVTHGLMEDILRELERGIVEPVGAVKPVHMAQPSVFTPDYVLNLMCRVADGKGASDPLHPVIASIEMSRMFWDLRPLPRFNACTELVVRKVFHNTQGYPACAWAALTKIEEEWGVSGEREMGIPLSSHGYPEQYRLFGVDGTLYHDLVLRQYEQELDCLQAKVDRFVVQRKAQREHVAALEGLNGREKDVLLNLLRNPVDSVTIEGHRTRHETAYSTAHTDLAHLEELGFLRSGKQGRALAYFPGGKLIDLA